MQQATAFADAAEQVVRLVGRGIAGLNALTALRFPSEEEERAYRQRVDQIMAKQAAHEAERLRQNPRLHYRSRKPLWLRLRYPLRRRQRPVSLCHESPDWYDY